MLRAGGQQGPCGHPPQPQAAAGAGGLPTQLQEHTALSVSAPGGGKAQPLHLPGVLWEGLLCPPPATLPLDPTSRKETESCGPVPIATECLKLDLVQGGRLCREQDTVKAAGLPGLESSTPGEGHREGGQGAEEGSGSPPDPCRGRRWQCQAGGGVPRKSSWQLAVEELEARDGPRTGVAAVRRPARRWHCTLWGEAQAVGAAEEMV